jgi:hypothetical protein
VEIFLDNKSISEYSFVEEGMNTLGYDTLNEVFFDVFEIKSKSLELVKEKKGDFNGLPIIELDLCIEDKIYKNVRFIVNEKSDIKINLNLLDHLNCVIYEKTNKNETKLKKTSVITEQTELVPLKETKKPKKLEKTEIVKEEKLIDKVKNEFLLNLKQELLENLKNEIEYGSISEILKDSIHNNFGTILENDSFQFRLQKLFQNDQNKFRKDLIEIAEKISRREVMRFSESGGGTNARHYDKLIFIIGDETNTDYTLSHNLNTKDLFITIYDQLTNEVVIADIININDNQTLIKFELPPSNQSCKVVILG